MSRLRALLALCCVLLVPLLAGCATAWPDPATLTPPTPIDGNAGKYMSPYTKDDVVAPWVDKARNAAIGAAVGGYIGREAGVRALGMVPIVGGWLGDKAGNAAGRQIAIKLAGGWDYIRNTSDLSFEKFDDLAVYMYAKYSKSEHYREVFNAVKDIYPEFQNKYEPAVKKAGKASAKAKS